ncbi:hypothetical protein [Hydrogenimonas sp. SS33]|uniref:hypothetical protein n=1 Tax=Hydrogenimonas leucolamina TaxID=2954236 RepID=UPI00336BE6ED
MNRVLLASFAALAATWIIAAAVIGQKSSQAESDYRERARLIQRYDTLKSRWSEKGQRELRSKMETLLRIYGIRPDIQKRRDRKVYTFTLTKKRADNVMNKLLHMPLAISRLSAEKSDATHLKVTVELPR